MDGLGVELGARDVFWRSWLGIVEKVRKSVGGVNDKRLVAWF